MLKTALIAGALALDLWLLGEIGFDLAMHNA